MRPSLAVHDLRDRLPTYAVSGGDVLMPHAASSERADFPHGIFSQFRAAHLLAASLLVNALVYRVTAILRASHPLKILDAVVGFVAVLVVDLRLRIRVRNERLRNEAM